MVVGKTDKVRSHEAYILVETQKIKIKQTKKDNFISLISAVKKLRQGHGHLR